MSSTPLSGQSVTLPLSQLTSLPHGVMARLLLTLLAMHPECYTRVLGGDELLVDCKCLHSRLQHYVSSNEFRDALRRGYPLFDTFLVQRKSGLFGCRDRRLQQQLLRAKSVQDIVSTVIQYYAGNPCGLLEHMGAWSTALSPNALELYLGDWGNSACTLSNPQFTPPFFVVTDFVQSARYFPLQQLSPGKRGLERKVYVTLEAYALSVAAFALSYVLVYRRGSSVTAYMLTVLEPSRALGSHLKGGVERLREELGRVLAGKRKELTDVPDPLLYLAVVDALRAPTGLVELVGVKASGKRGDVVLELPVELGLSRHLRTALSSLRGFSLVNLIARVVVDRDSGDEKRARLASILAQVLYLLAMIAMHVGDLRAEAAEALRLLHDHETVSLAESIGGVYEHAVRQLPRLVRSSVALAEKLV